MNLTDQITTSAPTLSSGAVAVTFGKFSQVTDAFVTFDDPQVANRVFAKTVSISGNIVTVTVKKMQLSATNTWGNAGNTDITGELVITATGT